MKKILFATIIAVAASCFGVAQTISVKYSDPKGLTCTFTAAALATSFSATAPINGGSAGVPAQDAPVTITKYADSCSSLLLKDLVKFTPGGTFTATLTAPVNGVQTSTMVMTFGNTFINSIADDESAVSVKTGLPVEKISFVYTNLFIKDLIDNTSTTCIFSTPIIAGGHPDSYCQ